MYPKTNRRSQKENARSAPEEIERSRLFEEQHLREIGSFLIERYDAVIVDGSRALDGLLLSCLELSESIFVVLTGEFPAVRNAQHYLTALARAGYGNEAVKLVVNRQPASTAGIPARTACCARRR